MCCSGQVAITSLNLLSLTFASLFNHNFLLVYLRLFVLLLFGFQYQSMIAVDDDIETDLHFFSLVHSVYLFIFFWLSFNLLV